MRKISQRVNYKIILLQLGEKSKTYARSASANDHIQAKRELIAEQIWRLKGSPPQDEAGRNADYLAAIELEQTLSLKNERGM